MSGKPSSTILITRGELCKAFRRHALPCIRGCCLRVLTGDTERFLDRVWETLATQSDCHAGSGD